MGRKWNMLGLVIVFALLFSGCALQTLNDLYQVPKRSEEYNNLQSAIDQNLGSRQYCAPLSGDNLQAIQMVDLDGDGSNEYLLFAKGASEKPLQVLIFRSEKGQYGLSDIIYHHGSAFDMVEYASIDDRPGYEIIIGCQISDQVSRSVSVYGYDEGKMVTQISAAYTRLMTCDLNADGRSEVMVLHPGETDQSNALAELYAHTDVGVGRVGQITLSQPADRIEQVVSGGLHGSKTAVYISCVAEDNTVQTDILADVDGEFTNLSNALPGGTQIYLPFERQLFPEDIDMDGVMELPAVEVMRPPAGSSLSAQLSLIRWYTVTDEALTQNKLYSCINFRNGWLFLLDGDWAQRMTVVQSGHVFVFYVWDEDYVSAQKVLTVYHFTGANRYEQAAQSGRFVVFQSDTVIYAAELGEYAADYGITEDSVVNSFRLIL